MSIVLAAAPFVSTGSACQGLWWPRRNTSGARHDVYLYVSCRHRLQRISTGALIIALGLLVDDAMITVRNHGA